MPKSQTVTITPNGSAPPPFRQQRWEWVHCDTPGYEGFAIEARSNLTIGEREQFRAELDRIDALDDAKDPELYALLSPHIRAWNAVGVDVLTGEDAPIPAPADGGPDVFQLIDPPQVSWIVLVTCLGYRVGKGLGWIPSLVASAPIAGPQVVENAQS